MNETKQDIARRERLHEWFKSDPSIWEDVKEELAIAYSNELDKVKSRTCTNREWSAGYVFGYGEVLDLERFYKKIWNPTTKQSKT